MSMITLHDLMLHELRDLYDAEHRIKDALAQWAERASADDLKRALAEYRDLAETHIGRLEEIFGLFDIEPERGGNISMEAILRETKKLMDEAENDNVRDAAIVAGARNAEHYEIAGYGTAATFAAMMGHDEAAALLGQSFDEEEEVEQAFLELAEDILDPTMGE